MVFVTGTDTGAGKTWATLSLMHRLRSCGKQVMGMKPVASGCEETTSGLRNDDAVRIRAAASALRDYALVNPYAFRTPVAPHIAALKTGATIDLDHIQAAFQALACDSEYMIVRVWVVGVCRWARGKPRQTWFENWIYL
jgi:dethiobiotin synthase